MQAGGTDDPDRTDVRRVAASPPGRADALVHVLRPQRNPAPRIRLAPGALVIGRGETCGLVLQGHDVSRRHCQIDLLGGEVIAGGEVLVTDLGSTNGTFVDGTRIAGTVSLSPGALLSIGHHLLLYERRGQRDLDQAETLERALRDADRGVLTTLPLPLRDGPVRAEFFYRSGDQPGGSAFFHRDLGDGVHAGFMLDVPGRRAGAAAHAVAAAGLLRQDGVLGTDPRDPAAVLARLNLALPMQAYDGLCVCVRYWVYLPAVRSLGFCAAGAHFSVLAAPNRSVARMPGAEHPPVGHSGDTRYHTQSATMPPGAMVYMFSDGAFACGSAEDFLQLLRAAPLPGAQEPRRLYDTLRPNAPPEDDFSVVALTFP